LREQRQFAAIVPATAPGEISRYLNHRNFDDVSLLMFPAYGTGSMINWFILLAV
jgi:hypothetical protein